MKTSDNIIEQAEMCEISIINVDKTFGSGESIVIALKEINLQISHGEFVCLLGPSGCGKSTLLNAIAGFSLPTHGEIVVKGDVVKEPGTDRGMVFQEYALFPWMNVEKNIAFGMDIKGESKEKCQSIVEDLLNTLGLSEFRTRFPKDLSGGCDSVLQ